MITYSFVIPHRNSPDLLARCLDSIPNREDTQILIVDDNSSESNVEMIKSISDRYNNVELVLLNEGCKGAGHARNVGLSYAVGKWILFADCDDSYTNNIELLLDQFIDSEYDVVYYNFNYISEKNGSIKQMLSFREDDISEYEKDILKYKLLPPWNKMVKKSLIDEHDIKFEECINGNDLFYSFQVGFYSKIIKYSSDIIYNYYMDNMGITNKKKNDDVYYLCKFEHAYKSNMFYERIGHKEWTRSIFVQLGAILVRKGFPSFIQSVKVFIDNKKNILARRNEFVDYFKLP